MVRFLGRGLFVLICIFLTLVLVRAFDARSQMALEPEHIIELQADYQAGRDGKLGWDGYVSLERELGAELLEKLGDRSTTASSFNRYNENSGTNPNNQATNWNYSYVMAPVEQIGSAVLIHGLTDSPYSVRATAEIFMNAGYRTYAPRLPGHGFNAGSLPSRDRFDWLGVVELAVREADKQRKEGQPLVVGGYSTGAALALVYALSCEDNGQPCPDRILLLSPAIEVSAFAWFAKLHLAVSWIPFFEQFKWESIYPEIDTYKFTSFPKNPGWDSAQLSSVLDAPDRPKWAPAVPFLHLRPTAASRPASRRSA